MKNNAKTIISNRLKELRKKHGYTQEELAGRAGVDYKHIQKLESNVPPSVRIDTLEKLAKAFDVPITKLLSKK